MFAIRTPYPLTFTFMFCQYRRYILKIFCTVHRLLHLLTLEDHREAALQNGKHQAAPLLPQQQTPNTYQGLINSS